MKVTYPCAHFILQEPHLGRKKGEVEWEKNSKLARFHDLIQHASPFSCQSYTYKQDEKSKFFTLLFLSFTISGCLPWYFCPLTQCPQLPQAPEHHLQNQESHSHATEWDRRHPAGCDFSESNEATGYELLKIIPTTWYLHCSPSKPSKAE